MVKRSKLQWCGHYSRSPGLAKTILQGTVKGGRRQGRQRKKWEGNIGEWTSLQFAKSQRAVKNREKWRKLVAKSPVVSQRPSRDEIGNLSVWFIISWRIMQTTETAFLPSRSMSQWECNSQRVQFSDQMTDCHISSALLNILRTSLAWCRIILSQNVAWKV